MADIVLDYAKAIRNRPVSAGLLRSLNTALEATDPRLGARIVSGGQPPKGKGGRRTGSTRHDVDSTGHAHAADLVLTIDGRDVRPGENKQLYARFLSNAAPFFPGIGHYPWGLHVGAGKTAAWGPTLSKRSLDPVFGRAIRAGRTGRKPRQIAQGAVPEAPARVAEGAPIPRPKPNRRGIKPQDAAQPPVNVIDFSSAGERDLALATPTITPAGSGRVPAGVAVPNVPSSQGQPESTGGTVPFDPTQFGAVPIQEFAAPASIPDAADRRGTVSPTVTAAPEPAITPAPAPAADTVSSQPASAAGAFDPTQFGAIPLDAPDAAVTPGPVPDTVGAQPVVADPTAVDPTTSESLVMGGVQGVTIGLADEIFAGLEAARLKLAGDERSFGEIFSTAQRIGSGEFQQAREANPNAFLAGEVAGAVGSGLAAAPVGLVARTAGRGLLTRTAAGAAEGTAFGAAVGAGTAEGDLADRAAGAGEGALIGAALGGTLPAVGTAVGAGVRAAGRQVSGSAETATTLIADRLKNANTTMQRALTRLNRAQKTAPGMTLADVGGEEVQQLLRAASNVPSEARSALFRKLNQRKQFQFKRLADAFGVAAGGSTDEFFETVAGLGRIRKDAAKPLFDKAFAQSVPFTKQLEEVLNRPLLRTAVARARTAAQNRGEDFEGVFARETGVDAAGVPTFEFTSVPATRDLHRVKMELDKIIGGLRRGRETNLTGVEIRDVTLAKQALLNAIQNPAYKQALKQYAGDSATINAAEEGLEILKKRPDEIRAFIDGLGTEAEKQMFRMGAARAFVDQIRNRAINRDAVGPVLENAQNIERIKAIFPNSTRRTLQRVQAMENLQTRTLRAVQGNSTTARQLLESQRAAEGVGVQDVLAVGTDVLTGGAAGATAANAARRGIGSVIGERLQGLRPEVADEVIRQLTSASGETIEAVTQRLQQLSQAQQRALTLTDLAILGLTPGAIIGTDAALAAP